VSPCKIFGKLEIDKCDISGCDFQIWIFANNIYSLDQIFVMGMNNNHTGA
jgi:hypothetical protein